MQEIWQEIYIKVRQHLLSQNRKSVLYDGDICAYRGTDGAKCAIGCLIADEHYDPSFEGKGVLADERLQAALAASGYPVDDQTEGLYAWLQLIHDRYPVSLWRHELDRLARQRGFTIED